MKITKNKEDSSVSIEYPLWPLEGSAEATIDEWENGEGFDVTLNGTKIELTHYEIDVITELSMKFGRIKMLK
jgi:hypothetical protein